MNRINHSSRFIEQFGNPVDVQGFGTSSIGDYCNVISGFPFKSELFNEDKAGMPLIRIRDVVRGYTGTYTTEECEQQFVVRAGDLLVGMDGDFAISAWRSEEALLNQRVCKITPKDNLITRNFIVYAVQPVLTSIEEKTNATTVKHISASQISSIRISDIDKSSVLAFDKVVQQADKSKFNGFKSRFIEMFSTEPKMCLSEVANITMGSSPDSKYYNLEKQGLPFYQGKTEFGDLYIGEASVFCSEPVRIAEPGDILLSVRAPVGTVNLSVSKCCIGRGLASIRPKNNIEQLYLFYALRLKEADIDALGTGSTFKAINKDTLFSFRIEVGNKERQNEFVHFAKQSDKSKYLN